MTLIPGNLAVCRLNPGDAVPDWADGAFLSITRTPAELSIVCDASLVPAGVACEGDWRALVVDGQLDFGLVGVLAGMSGALAEAGVSVFVVSTYDTDYLLVKAASLERAVGALRAAGHRVDGRSS